MFRGPWGGACPNPRSGGGPMKMDSPMMGMVCRIPPIIRSGAERFPLVIAPAAGVKI